MLNESSRFKILCFIAGRTATDNQDFTVLLLLHASKSEGKGDGGNDLAISQSPRTGG